MLNRAYSLLEIKQVDEDARIITGWATTPTADRLNDVVEPMGAQFKLPMPLLWQHTQRRADRPRHACQGHQGRHRDHCQDRQGRDRRDRPRLVADQGRARPRSVDRLQGDRARVHSRRPKASASRNGIGWSCLRDDPGERRQHHHHRSVRSTLRSGPRQANEPHRVVHLNPPGASGIPNQVAQEGTKMKTIAEQITALEAQARRERGAHGSRDAEEPRRGSHHATPPSRRNSTTSAPRSRRSTRISCACAQLEKAKASAAKPVVKADTGARGRSRCAAARITSGRSRNWRPACVCAEGQVSGMSHKQYRPGG